MLVITDPTTSRIKAIAVIRYAKENIRAAFSSLNDPYIVQELINAHNRGIDVKVAGDVDNSSDQGFQDLIAAGVPVTFGDGTLEYKPDPYRDPSHRDGSINFMAENAIVADRNYIWISPLPATTDILEADPISVAYIAFLIQSEDVARNVFMEVNQMTGGMFSTVLDFYNTTQKAVTEREPFYLLNDNLELELHFSPQERLTKTLIDNVLGAKASIKVMTSWIGSEDFYNAIKYKASVPIFNVKGVVDDSPDPAPSTYARNFSSNATTDANFKYDDSSSKIKYTLAIIDDEKASDGRKYPEKVIIMSIPIYDGYPYHDDTTRPYESDSFSDAFIMIFTNNKKQGETSPIFSWAEQIFNLKYGS